MSRFGAHPEKSPICRHDADFGTAHGFAARCVARGVRRGRSANPLLDQASGEPDANRANLRRRGCGSNSSAVSHVSDARCVDQSTRWTIAKTSCQGMAPPANGSPRIATPRLTGALRHQSRRHRYKHPRARTPDLTSRCLLYGRRRRARSHPTSHQGKRLFGVDAATSKAMDGPFVKSWSGAVSDIATRRNEYEPDGMPEGTRIWTITCSAALALKSRTDSPTTDSHSDFAGSTGFVDSRPRSVCALVFVTVNGT